jgi:putative oxidoreductase
MMSATVLSPTRRSFSLPSTYNTVLGWADRIPLSLVQLVARLAMAHVFWNSAQSKLASWPVTVQLFAMEYRVPVLPPDVAAVLGTATELTGSILIFLGLFTRLGSLALLGLVSVIQLFVYPQNWPDHLLWASLLLLLLARGAGVISLDYLAKRFFARSM